MAKSTVCAFWRNTTVDYDSYAELLKQYPATINNDYFMPDELRRRFESGTVTVAEDSGALYLFEKREGFTKLHFRLQSDTAAITYASNRPLAAYLVYRESRYPETAANWLLKQGFQKTMTLRRHTAAAITGELSLAGTSRADVNEAYAMFGEHFKAAEVDLPCRELYDGALCIRAKDGALSGVIYLGQRPAIAVAPEAHGKGLGSKLYRAYAATKVKNGKIPTFHAFISPDNTASLAMFKSLGFAPGDVLSVCYVRG